MKPEADVRHLLGEYERRRVEEFANVSSTNRLAWVNEGRIDALQWVLDEAAEEPEGFQ